MSTQEQKEIVFDSSKLESSVKDGVLKLVYTDKDAYMESCPIPEKQFKEIAAYDKEYLAKASEFMAAEAKKYFLEQKDVNDIRIELPFGHNSNGHTEGRFKRSYEWKGINGLPDGKKTSFQLKVQHPVHGVSKSTIKDLEKELTKAILNIDL